MAQFTDFDVNHPDNEWFQVMRWQVEGAPSTSTSFSLRNHDGTYTIAEGTGFTYDGAGRVIGGTITVLTHLSGNQSETLAEIEGLSLAAGIFRTTMVNFITDGFAMANFVLGTDDSFELLGTDTDTSDPLGRHQFWLGDGDDTVTRLKDNYLIHMVGGDDHLDLGNTAFGLSVGLNNWVSYRYNLDGTEFTPTGNSGYANYNLRIALDSNNIYNGNWWQAEGFATDGNENDTIEAIVNVEGSNGNDWITGLNIFDPITDPAATNDVTGSTVYGWDGDDRIERAKFGFGGEGDDLMTTMWGGDWQGIGPHIGSTLKGEAGNDTFWIGIDGAGPTHEVLHTIDGGKDIDTVEVTWNGVPDANYTGGTDLFLDLTNSLPSSIYTNRYHFVDIENIEGGAASEFFTGNELDNELLGFGRSDTLLGWAGDDHLDGGIGDDFLWGFDGGNTTYGISGTDNDTLIGGAGNDDLRGDTGDDLLIGGADADSMNGGYGIDKASYEGSSVGVVVDLTAGTGTDGDAEGDTLTNIENLDGSDHRDHLFGDGGENILDGAGSFDVMIGRGGNDVYAVDDSSDAVIEADGEGFDNVYASIDYIIPEDSE
ncbi:MAG: calcium-binding protein, partial [Pseudomonadota bacterium]